MKLKTTKITLPFVVIMIFIFFAANAQQNLKMQKFQIEKSCNQSIVKHNSGKLNKSISELNYNLSAACGSVIYNTSGTYDVTLTATNAGGSGCHPLFTNLDIEQWGSSTYSANAPVGWGTYNLDILGGPVSTYQETTSPGEGISSVKLVTTTGYAAFFGPGLDTLGGLISLGGDWSTEPNNGIPYTQKPTSIDFMYKSNIMSGDTGVLAIRLSHWDGIQTVVDASGVVIFQGAPVTNWTSMNLPINYLTSDTPDTLNIWAFSSVWWLTPAIPGSELYLDDFVLNVTPLSATATSTDDIGGCSGTATVSASGGTSPYTYSWNTSPAQTTATATGLCGGTTYTVTVTDANNCIASTSTTIVNIGNPPIANFTASATTINVGDNIDFYDLSQNAASWIWAFSNGSPFTSNSQNPTNITYNTVGSFDVALTVSNANGTDNITKTAYINVIGGTGVDDIGTEKYIKVIPNPTTGKFVIEMNITKVTDLEIKLLNVIGQVIYQEKLNRYVGEYQKAVNVGALPKGIYNLQLISDEGIINKKIMVE